MEEEMRNQIRMDLDLGLNADTLDVAEEMQLRLNILAEAARLQFRNAVLNAQNFVLTRLLNTDMKLRHVWFEYADHQDYVRALTEGKAITFLIAVERIRRFTRAAHVKWHIFRRFFWRTTHMERYYHYVELRKMEVRATRANRLYDGTI